MLFALALAGCGGFDRDDAAEVVQRDLFGDPGTRWRVVLETSTSRIGFKMLPWDPERFWAPGNCDVRAYAWTALDFAMELACLQEIDRLGAIELVTSGLNSRSPLGEPEDVQAVDISSLDMEAVRLSQSEDRDKRRLYLVKIRENFFQEESCDLFHDRARNGRRAPLTLWLPSPRFDEVTGIAEADDNSRSVEFRYHHDTSVAGNLREHCMVTGSLPPGGPRTAQSMVRKFDDGWRVESTEWQR